MTHTAFTQMSFTERTFQMIPKAVPMLEKKSLHLACLISNELVNNRRTYVGSQNKDPRLGKIFLTSIWRLVAPYFKNIHVWSYLSKSFWKMFNAFKHLSCKQFLSKPLNCYEHSSSIVTWYGPVLSWCNWTIVLSQIQGAMTENWVKNRICTYPKYSRYTQRWKHIFIINQWQNFHVFNTNAK